MSKRRHPPVDDADLGRGPEAASGSIETKIAAVRAAARHEFPAPDIDQMLAEIERGYEAGAVP